MRLVLNIRRRNQYEWVIAFILFVPFLFGLMIDGLGTSSLIKYSLDVAWLFLLCGLFLNRIRLSTPELEKLLNMVFIFFGVTLIGFVLGEKSPFYYMWGFRNNFRFFIYFFACSVFLRRDDAEGYLNALDLLFYLNFIVVLFQFFVQGWSGDYLGGIFGIHKGSNAATIIFLLIVCARAILNTFNYSESIWVCLIKCLFSIIVSIFAELKIFFVLLGLLVGLSSVYTKNSTRKVIVIIFSVAALYIGAQLLAVIFPSWENWFSIEYMMEHVSSTNGYTDSGDLNRLTGVHIIWGNFLITWPERLFGLGLGNCDTSAFSFLNTSFFQRYAYLHYNWFSIAFMFLETGILGLGFYVGFFVVLYVCINRRLKDDPEAKVYCQLAKVLTVVSMILIVYNQSMRIEAAYMIYFVLALPFIQQKQPETESVNHEYSIKEAKP
ncbi:MAG: hypothetical protein IKJ65_04535 [Clostridia bacterium]|nr:hypothetical protein [Clostridia bacterium]